MLNNLVPIVDNLAGRLILGMLNMSSDHPALTGVLLAALAGTVALAWADLLGRGWGTAPAGDARPIRLWRR